MSKNETSANVAGGYSSSILDVLRSACQISKTLAIQTDGGSYKALTYQELFRLATLGGSEVLGLEATTGSFVVGKDFDAILVDPLVADSPFDVFSTDTFSDVLQKFLFLGDDRNMIDVFVSGKRVCGNNKMENPRQPIVQKYRTQADIYHSEHRILRYHFAPLKT
ncbi:guanine deaminase-like [Haliotis rufescens]|uniref:guanine deaminase-like n=1 Tax=Haliotis rufescens TaxID=6454 RepID=UPI00201F574E|nr:guanine deaminase-like [Haliotis rufescens]